MTVCPTSRQEDAGNTVLVFYSEGFYAGTMARGRPFIDDMLGLWKAGPRPLRDTRHQDDPFSNHVLEHSRRRLQRMRLDDFSSPSIHCPDPRTEHLEIVGVQ